MPQINKSSEYFNTVLYTGNGTTDHAITGVGFQPDWVWSKSRSNTTEHNGFDSVRGATEQLYISATYAESTQTESLKSFDSDGFTLGTRSDMNGSSNTYVSWNWKANGVGVSNTSGSITSTVSANTTSGFSIVSYTGTGSVSTIGHSLGSTPACIIIKNRTDVTGWTVYHKILTGTSSLGLDTTNTTNTGIGVFNNTDPTSSVFTVGTANGTNGSGDSMIAYCFAEKKGFSKFGSYTGNGNADGTFVYTGFKPAWIMVKRTDSTNDWMMFDNKRDSFNTAQKYLRANVSNAEGGSNDYVDFVSNGIKFRRNGLDVNGSGASYIYMCFAESPLVGTNNIPATAR